MKFKKTTLAGIIVSACLIAGTTTAFAAVNSDRPTQEAAPTAEESSADVTTPDSVDEVDVEWWTYDEYKAWLEQEKQNIAELVKQGASGWTQDRGDFTWTQEVADETIALYEKTLEEIENGVRISKSVNGSDDVIISESPDGSDILMQDNGGQYSTDDEIYQYIVEDDGTVTPSDDSVYRTLDSLTEEEFFSRYSEYGLTYENGRLYYNGEPVKYFDDIADMYSTDDGGVTEFVAYLDSDGVVVLDAVREEATDDSAGELTGVRVLSGEELEQKSAELDF